MLVLVVLLLGPVASLRAQEAPRSASYWTKELSRQTDSTRKAEVLLFMAKDMETTDPAQHWPSPSTRSTWVRS